MTRPCLVRCIRARLFRPAHFLVACLLSASLLAGQSLESLASAYRDKSTPARRNAVLRFAAAHPRDASGALALFVVGVTDVEGKDYKDAIQRLKAARGRLPQLADYISFFLGTAYLETEDFRAAVGEFNSVVSHSPESPRAVDAQLLAARSYLEDGSPQEAIRILKQLGGKMPQPQGDLALASSYEAAGDLASAAIKYQNVYYGFPAEKEAA
jgi:soluble lytic murein transglycosylase